MTPTLRKANKALIIRDSWTRRRVDVKAGWYETPVFAISDGQSEVCDGNQDLRIDPLVFAPDLPPVGVALPQFCGEHRTPTGADCGERSRISIRWHHKFPVRHR
jgi:hypothetical protein